MKQMEPPLLPNKLTTTKLTDVFFESDEEYADLSFQGDHALGLQAEYLVLQRVAFHSILMDGAQLFAPKLTDVRLSDCSLANANCEKLIAHRVEFLRCRLVGLNGTEGHFQNVHFRACDGQLARFRFCSFKSVLFEACNLAGANFQGADLSNVSFDHCDLSNAEMSQAKLGGTDFRTSKIENLRVGAEEVKGAVVDHFQAAYMASLLGLVIKSDDET